MISDKLKVCVCMCVILLFAVDKTKNMSIWATVVKREHEQKCTCEILISKVKTEKKSELVRLSVKRKLIIIKHYLMIQAI